jgi:hypothetical protein
VPSAQSTTMKLFRSSLESFAQWANAIATKSKCQLAAHGMRCSDPLQHTLEHDMGKQNACLGCPFIANRPEM